MYYQRKIDQELSDWAKSENHKPLLLRGARQVGKTTAVRHLAEKFAHFVEVDFNNRPDVHYMFDGTYSTHEICQLLSLQTRIPIEAGKTLIFFDEIQACPAAINRLRYFYEECPQLHLIAAGSLLEFALEGLPSYGVGRIRSIFMYPFSIEEFFHATGNGPLATFIDKASPSAPLPEAIHETAVRLLRQFLALGGMPAVVAEFCSSGSVLECQRLLGDLVQSFRDDFAKYRNKVPSPRIDAVFRSVAEQGLGKFVISRVDAECNRDQIRAALETLILAGLVYPVTHTSANGIPLGAEINEKYQRMIFMDTGLLQNVLGLNIADFFQPSADLQVVNRGAIAETFVGNEIVKAGNMFQREHLYCWHREKSGSNAEVDFVVQTGDKIRPIEVKSGTKGSMQSMRLFMQLKGTDWGIRTSLENFSEYDNIKIFPLYAIRNALRR